MQSIERLLPLVKLQFDMKEFEEQQTVSNSTALQLFECILFPIISREDCYQIVCNKLGTHLYELNSFEIGEFVNCFGLFSDHLKLKIEINHQNTNKTLDFFC